ncbi:MAG: hypothetical protein WC346_05930 [Methanogenium sp.]|jgi:hypothetical protein
MAIRIRKVGNKVIAICAARSVPKEGDIYLDDIAHHALTNKFSRDFSEEGFMKNIFDLEELYLVEKEESNNANRNWWDSIFQLQSLSMNNKYIVYNKGKINATNTR